MLRDICGFVIEFNWTAISAIITALSTFFLVLVTIFYAYRTHHMAKTMKAQFDAENRPYFDFGQIHGLLGLKKDEGGGPDKAFAILKPYLKNVGRSIAHFEVEVATYGSIDISKGKGVGFTGSLLPNSEPHGFDLGFQVPKIPQSENDGPPEFVLRVKYGPLKEHKPYYTEVRFTAQPEHFNVDDLEPIQCGNWIKDVT